MAYLDRSTEGKTLLSSSLCENPVELDNLSDALHVLRLRRQCVYADLRDFLFGTVP